MFWYFLSSTALPVGKLPLLKPVKNVKFGRLLTDENIE